MERDRQKKNQCPHHPKSQGDLPRKHSGYKQTNVVMQTEKESVAMKLATSRIHASNQLTKGHKDKKSINQIAKEVNDACDSNMSPKTAGTHVIKGRINTLPLKRGPSGSFARPILNASKWACAASSCIQLEQAEATTQLSLKDMPKRVNVCVNFAGHHRCRDDLTRRPRSLTADLFTVGMTNVTEHWRLQWTTHQN